MAVTEFALVAPTTCVLMLALFDLGHGIYYASQMQGAIHEAARQATVGDKTGAQIDNFVTSRVNKLVKNPTITITKKNYADFTGVKKAEKIVTDTAPFGTYNAKAGLTPGDCHEDANQNGSWDADRGRTGIGGADDIVYYEIAVTYDRIFPAWALIGAPSTQTVKVNTVLKNQPFAAQNKSAPVVCA